MFICAKLFSIEYLNQLGSIEGSFIAISRYAIDHFPDLKWWPLWFCGMPYNTVYGPLLQHLVALVAVVLRIPPALAFHQTIALFYCLGPVTLFWMTARFSGSVAAGFWSGVLYSVASPAVLLIPAIRHDVGGALHLRRLYNLIVYGESPHIAALALMPLALIAVDVAIQRGKPAHYALAAISIAAVALTNVTGSVGFALLLIAYVLAIPRTRSLPRIALIAALAWLLAMPWLSPSTILLIIENSEHSRGTTYSFHFLSLVLILAAAAACARLRVNGFLRFALSLTVIASAIALPAIFWASPSSLSRIASNWNSKWAAVLSLDSSLRRFRGRRSSPHLSHSRFWYTNTASQRS